MGAKQSSSPSANGRTRAYSGSDLPSSTSSSSSNGTGRTGSMTGMRYHHAYGYGSSVHPGGAGTTGTGSTASGGMITGTGTSSSSSALSSGSQHIPARPAGSRVPPAGTSPGSLLGVSASSSTTNTTTTTSRPPSGITIPTQGLGGGGGGGGGGAYSSGQGSGSSTPEEEGPAAERDRSAGGGHHSGGPRLVVGSLPAHLSPHLFGGFKCPVCSKFVSSDEMDLHLVMCLTRPRVTYNEDVLSKDAGECAICLEELVQGDTIARLPCLCIYHKGCIDEWFEVNRSCPEHPSD